HPRTWALPGVCVSAAGLRLAETPYASTLAEYRIRSADGTTTRRLDQNSAEEWVDLGTYTFDAGSAGAVELYDVTGETLSQGRVLFFDAVRWVPVGEDEADIELVSVTYGDGSANITVAAGEVLPVHFTVRNRGTLAVDGQGPQASLRSDGSFDPANGYVYDEGECFLGAEGQDYPVYPKETGRIRVTLGSTNRNMPCTGGIGGYPWRWGIDGPLQPGQSRTVTGYIRFRVPGEVTLKAGLIQEYVRYFAEDVATKTITVVPERITPVVSVYDTEARPLAYVYKLANIPDNLLARTRNPLSITRGEYVGSFFWNGKFTNWGAGGPLGQNDGFLIEQTRLFRAPVDGTYTFRTTSDDGSWLWINGREVVVNSGLHAVRSASGTIDLKAGIHTLSFKYFDRTGNASAGYDMQLPNETDFRPVRDMLEDTPRVGRIFRAPPEILLAADDQGGSGIARWRYSFDYEAWTETTGSVLNLGKFVSGSYNLSYQAIDNAGNASPVETLSFSINQELPVERSYLPRVSRIVSAPVARLEPYPIP
ncbi:MAG: N-acetylmuramoyl-L-alanine amidase, partial [Chloroflexaceae bacterium]|nr:N-acetylmuramoyl-L-alanine amidase [Chloroflexaceae bacterium]